MTKEQLETMRNLLNAVQTIRREAEDHYLPFKVAAAIERADQLQAECGFVYDDWTASAARTIPE